MTYYQQLDGSEIVIIHKNEDGSLEVGSANTVYYSHSPNEEFMIIEDRYPLTKETLPILIEELTELVKE